MAEFTKEDTAFKVPQAAEESIPDAEEVKATKARMPDDMKTMAAILRLLEEHDAETSADIMEYVYRRTKRTKSKDYPF